jgi:hypothetical protein
VALVVEVVNAKNFRGGVVLSRPQLAQLRIPVTSLNRPALALLDRLLRQLGRISAAWFHCESYELLLPRTAGRDIVKTS